MSNPNYDFEQRVVYRALTRMTEDFALIQSGFQFWLSTLSAKELEPTEFAEGLKSHLGISNDQKRVLIVSLHSSLAGSIDDLAPVPGALIGSGQGAGAAQAQSNQPQQGKSEKFTPASSAHHIITSHFMQTMAKGVCKSGKAAATDLSDIVAETIKSVADTSLHATLLQWADDGFIKIKLPKSISRESCVEVAHFLYMSSTEAIGPVESDKIMDKVLKLLMELDEAERFDPYSLT